MYDDLAYLWPLISPADKYAKVANDWKDALLENLGPEKRDVLELGVGGGHNLSHITSNFNVTAGWVSSSALRVSNCVGQASQTSSICWPLDQPLLVGWMDSTDFKNRTGFGFLQIRNQKFFLWFHGQIFSLPSIFLLGK